MVSTTLGDRCSTRSTIQSSRIQRSNA
jgi:hypothetical protein